MDSPATSKCKWSRSEVIAAIRRWNLLYGQPPAAGEWNPSMAKRLGHTDRVERFYQGRWPNYRTVVKLFGGWNDAILAAGLRPRPRGGRRGQARASVAADVPHSETEELCQLKGIDSEREAVPGLRRPGPWFRRLVVSRS